MALDGTASHGLIRVWLTADTHRPIARWERRGADDSKAIPLIWC